MDAPALLSLRFAPRQQWPQMYREDEAMWIHKVCSSQLARVGTSVQ